MVMEQASISRAHGQVCGILIFLSRCPAEGARARVVGTVGRVTDLAHNTVVRMVVEGARCTPLPPEQGHVTTAHP